MAAHPLKASRLLRSLEARIAGARSRVEADCARAEQAVYLARQGAAGRADEIVRDLRLRYDGRPDIAVAVWVNLCEGIGCHFSDMGRDAALKIRRADALAMASGLTQLGALTAAWSAHMDYLAASFEAMADDLGRALRLADPDNHGARSRACLVAAQAFHFAGRADLAQPWYEATRQHALDDGDDATLGALIHNASWLRATALRHDVILAGRPAPDTEHALMSADSACHFDRFVGVSSLQSLAPMLRAQLLAVLGRPAEAVRLYDLHFDASLGEGVRQTIEADLLADRAHCHAAIGDVAGARRHAEAALARLQTPGHCVDRVVAHKRLAQVLTVLGDVDRAAAQHALADVAWAGHRADQRRALAAVDKVLDGSLPHRLRRS